MTDEKTPPLVTWVISCFDKRRENPFPVYNRTFFLDWSSLSKNEVAEVLSIVNDTSGDSKHSPEGFDTSVVTLSRSRSTPDSRMLKFRQHFIESSEDECTRRFQEVQENFGDIKFVILNGEYFEDDTGQPITEYEMIQHVSGQEFPIIFGDPKSVMRLGPVPPKAVESWTSTKAGTVAHFLDVVRRISSSSWYRSPQSITYLSPSKQSADGKPLAESKLLEALFPNDEQTTAVLAYFRQLHAGDKLLVKACEIYIEHCSDGRKTLWVDERKQNFEKLVDSNPAPFQVGSGSVPKIVET